jgi:hypothetical protein
MTRNGEHRRLTVEVLAGIYGQGFGGAGLRLDWD